MRENRKPLPRSLSWADALFGDTEPTVEAPATAAPPAVAPPVVSVLDDDSDGIRIEPYHEPTRRRLGRRSFRRGLPERSASVASPTRSGLLTRAGGLRAPKRPAQPRTAEPRRALQIEIPIAALPLSADSPPPPERFAILSVPPPSVEGPSSDMELMEIEASEVEILDEPEAPPAPLSVEESLAAMLGSELPTGADDWGSSDALSDPASGMTLVRALTLEDVVSSPMAAVAEPIPSMPPPLPAARTSELPPLPRAPTPRPVAPPSELASPTTPPPRVTLPRNPSIPPLAAAPAREIQARSPSIQARSPSVPPPLTARSVLPRTPSKAPAPVWTSKKRASLPPKTDLVVGIDLGTTYSCVAIAEGSSVRVISTRRGVPTMPSAVAFEASGRAILADAALRYLPTSPENTIVGWKRLLGRTFDSPIVEEVQRHFAYQIVAAENGDAAVRVHGQTVSLEEVAAEVLEELRIAATMQVKSKINRAVITCPAHFNEAQRGAIRKAGELAGFHVERVLSEPTAAALAYGFGKGFDGKKIMVYDLGGGTFDVSLLLVKGETYEVLATGGDSFLGGLDFDATIVRLLVEALQAKDDIDARTDPAAIAKLMQYAERAKRELSDAESTVIEIDHLVVQPHAARSLRLEVKRAQVEKLFSPIIDHTLELVQDVCQRAGLMPKDVDEVVLVGGQTRTPIIARKVRSMLGKEPRTGIDPDEAVALGAARFGQGLLEKSNVKLIDALPMSIGVGLPGGRFHKLVPRDSALPATHVHTLRTTRDNQPSLELYFFQGEADQAEHNEPLGSLVLSGLPRGPKGTVVVEVQLGVSEEQILSVAAREQKSGRSIETQFGTKTMSAEVRAKLELPPEPTHEDLKKRRYQVGRPKGVWGWLTKVLGR